MIKIKRITLFVIIFIAISVSYITSYFIFISTLHPISSFEEAKKIITGQIKDDSDLYAVFKMAKVKRIIESNFLEDADKTKMVDYAMKAMALSLGDEYTKYYTKEEYRVLKEDSAGKHNGIGATVDYDGETHTLVISEIVKDGPADKAGLKAKDKIIKINDKDIKEMTYNEITSIIRGNEDINKNTDNNKIKLTIIRIANSKEEINFEVIRAEIKTPSVNYKTIGDLLYVRILNFGDNTVKEFKEAYEYGLNNNVKGIILDLRENLGGSLDKAVSIADMLMPKGLIVYTKDKAGKTVKYESDEKECNLPIVALMNHNTASASEALLGALKDSKKAILVGEKSYGKGIVQAIFDLGDGTGLKVTTSEYHTPSGEKIHKVGIEPDYDIDLPANYKSPFEIEDENDDTQLKKAIELLN